MRIGLDHQLAATHAPGVGRYVRELTRALAHEPGDHELRLLALGLDRRRVRDLGLERAVVPVRRRRLPLPRRVLAWPWPGVDVLCGGVDLFHHALPAPVTVARARQTLFLSELPAPDSPAGSRLRDGLRRQQAAIVCSRHAALRLEQEFGAHRSLVHVVPVGADHWLRDAEPRERSEGDPTLLVLGAPRPDRMPHEVIAAHRRLRARGVDVGLVACGAPAPDGTTWEQLLASVPDARAVAPDESRLPALVAACDVLVHLSADETTAVTPLEACSFGLAVVASRLPAFVDDLGDHGRWVDPGAEAEDLTGRLATALALDLSPEQRLARRRLAARFTWREHARRTLQVWRGVLAASADRA